MPLRYWPFYCEENIWQLCSDETALASVPAAERRVVFISNSRRQVPMRKQRAGHGDPVGWDYHVVLLAGKRVWDLDTTLGLPVDLDRWARESFFPLDPTRLPRFRIVVAAEYLSRFASDRSHMRDERGRWRQPPPPWPPIGTGMTLMNFVDLETPFVGEVLDLETLLRRG